MRLQENLILVMAMMVALGVVSCLAQENAAGSEQRGAVVGPDDTITILALNVDEISKAWRVGSSGDLSLPLIGRVRVAGYTTEQIEKEIRDRLDRLVIDPQVTVYISEFRSKPVSVTGAVQKPGIIQMEGSKTLFDVLMMAGGPKDAGPTLTVTRSVEQGKILYPGTRSTEEGKYSIATLQLKEVIEGKSAAANLKIEPGDVVAVTDVKQPQYVHIVGEVNKPGAVELVTQPTVSLLKLIAVAGGLTRTASSKHTVIRHVGDAGVQTDIAYINLGKIMAGKARDLQLSSGDIVVIGASNLKQYIQVASLAAVNAGVYVLATL